MTIGEQAKTRRFEAPDSESHQEFDRSNDDYTPRLFWVIERVRYAGSW